MKFRSRHGGCIDAVSAAAFVVRNHMVTPTDVSALAIACKMPAKIPNTYQCKRLLALLRKASEEGFNTEA